MNIKILKLRSGEEIACQVLEENETIIKIYQPMLIKTTSSYDLAGRVIDVTTLHDWLMNTDNKNIDLPVNHVAFITEPNKDTMKMYQMESNKEFTEKVSFESEPNKDEINDFISELLKTTTEIMDTMNIPPWDEQPQPKPNKRKRKSKKPTSPPDMVDEKELDRHMIMMQLYIPAESIMNMITSGILDPQVLLDMIGEVKKRNRFTGDEKKKKTFGNDFTDWNPDPNSTDYQ